MAATAKCDHDCQGEHPCVCDGLREHVHHICRNADCVCHTAAAYGDELAQGPRGYVYIPAGAVLTREKVQEVTA